MAARYIAIEGPIGVGKTSLARRMAERTGASLVLEEDVEAQNPFLPLFYKDPRRYAFNTQVAFLLNRWRQQRELAPRVGREPLIADYLIEKDEVFARLNLNAEEFALYERIRALLRAEAIPRPDAVVMLEAEPEILLKRIRKRGIGYERGITRSYLKELTVAYTETFFDYKETPLLVVNTSEIDIVESEEDLTNLLEQIETLESGTKHYIPLGS